MPSSTFRFIPILQAMTKSMGSFFICAMLFSHRSSAETVKQGWVPIPGAETYEYEISEGPNFESDHLVRQGNTKNPTIETDLRAGTYQLRVRALGAEGRAGKWNTPVRLFVKSTPPEFRTPKSGEAVEVSSASTTINFEWTTVSGAQDYEIKLRAPDGKNLSKIVLSPVSQFEGLAAGAWQAKVVARQTGQPITETANIPFTVSYKSLPRPRFRHPLNNDALTAWELIRLRWTRSVPGKHSEVVITKISSAITNISREKVESSSETWIPALAPGRYQITIRDFSAETQDFAEDSITVVVQEDPMGYNSMYLGATWRIFGLEIDTYGGVNQNNRTMDDTTLLSPTSSVIPILETRIQTRILSPWGGEFDYSQFLTRLSYSSTSSKVASSQHPTLRRFKLGPTYTLERLGKTKPTQLKALLGYSMFNISAFDLKDQVAGTNFSLISLFLSAEQRWGGWNSRYDLLGEVQVGVPLFTLHATDFGTGRPAPIPSLQLRVYGRRKITESGRIFVGGEANLEYLRVSETSGDDTKWRRISAGPQVGLEWDL